MLVRCRAWLRAKVATRVTKLRSVQARIRGRRLLLCIGDSHIEPMQDVRDLRLLPGTAIAVESVGGATGSGIANPNSRTNARQRFLKALNLTTRAFTVMSCLGEVDAGFLVFAGDAAKTPLERCDVALRRYFEFLDEMVLRRKRGLLVVTVIPPTIEDYSNWHGLRGQRRDVDATWLERAQMTTYWNTELSSWCRDHGVPVIDVAAAVTDVSTGRVTPEFANTDPADHHLDRRKHAQLLTDLLRGQGFD